MSMMLRRQMLMQGGVNGWSKQTITSDKNYTAANSVVSFLSNYLPSAYRYAVVLADNTAEPEDNQFLGAIFLPTRSDVHGARWRNNAYDQRLVMNAGGVDLKLNQGDTVSMFWRTEPIGSDEPSTDWNYSCITPGAMSRASEVKQALIDVGTWGLMISVADYDFATIPQTNQAYCESIAINSGSFTGSYVRSSSGTSYGSGSNWASSYGLVTDSTTKIACFYI